MRQMECLRWRLMFCSVPIGVDHWQDTSRSEWPSCCRDGVRMGVIGTCDALKGPQASTALITTHTLRIDTREDEASQLDNQLKSFWDLETLGIKDADQSVYERFNHSIQFEDGRYQVTLPCMEGSTPHTPQQLRHKCQEAMAY